ncbi:MAG: flagellar filament capping protein FliD [Calditrichia bacterium]
MISSVGTSNIEMLLQSYRSLEERPIRRLESQRSTIDNRISLFSSLKSKLKTLETLAKNFTYTDSTSIFGSKAVSLSDTSYFTATVTSSAVATPHTVFVSQLAKADKIVSNQYTLEDTDLITTLGSGTFTFEVTVNGTANQVSIEIETGDDNEAILDKIVTAVNNTTDIGITASIIQDTETTGRLVFTSEETGADYEMSLSDITGNLLTTLGMNDSVAMNGTSGGYVYTASELNAIVIIDGITLQRNSNIIENAIEGITLNLQKVHETGDDPVTLNVTHDTEAIKGKIEEFIEAYNEIINFIHNNTNVDTTTYKRSALSGDFAISNMKLQLRNLMAEPISGLPEGDPVIFPDLGITTDRQGRLSISDSDTLEELLEGSLEKVSAFFNSANGISNRLIDFLDDYTGGEGIIEKRKDVLQSQIQLINERITRMEQVVDLKIEYYRRQFSQLQTAYNMFSSQYSSINNLMQSNFIY